MIISSLIAKFKTVKDFRSSQGKRYDLETILTLIFLGMFCGNFTYKHLEQFLQENKIELVKLLNLNSTQLPSYSTIRRAIMGITLPEFMKLFLDFTNQLYPEKNSPDWIAIDGKYSKNTLKNYGKNSQNMLMTVSLFSQKTKLIVYQESLESKKSSEIKQVQDIIKKCGLKNQVFTLDALHCNKSTTKTIIESKNDYLITVKKNQIKLS